MPSATSPRPPRRRAWTTGNTTAAYDESYSYDVVGNLTSKAGWSYVYPASGAGSVRPHAVSTVGGYPYTYDNNGNLLSGGVRRYAWTAENQPRAIWHWGVTETYAYDADGQRVSRTRQGVTTFYLGGLWEEELPSGTTRSHYAFHDQVIAQRERVNGTDTVLYLHGDHLGSISLATSSTAPATVVSQQEFLPFGGIRSGFIGQTSLNYTGQRRDATGHLYYNARYYDPALGRFSGGP